MGGGGRGGRGLRRRVGCARRGWRRRLLFEYLLRLGDDRLVLGHRLSEWCGHGPILEEDIALANVALDLIGQATHFLQLAGQVEGKGRDEDALAYFRDAIDYRNVNLVELPNGDFGRTIVRQFLFDAWSVLLLDGLQRAAHTKLAGIAAKAYKEARYHVRHSGEWVHSTGRRHGGESSAGPDGAGRALALHRRAVRGGRGGPAARGRGRTGAGGARARLA